MARRSRGTLLTYYLKWLNRQGLWIIGPVY